MEALFVLLLLAAGIWYWSSRRNPNPVTPPHSQSPASTSGGQQVASVESRERVHLQTALEFARQQHATLDRKAREQERWRIEQGSRSMAQIDLLSGVEFEHYLAGLFREQGYAVETTAISGDFGADLILIRDAVRIAVQAKRWNDRVGVSAVQEAAAARDYYQCGEAWVVTTSHFTAAAVTLAQKTRVVLVDRTGLARWIGQR